MFGLLKDWSSNTARLSLPVVLVRGRVQANFVVHDANGHALAYFYFKDEPGRRAAAKMLTRDEARAFMEPE